MAQLNQSQVVGKRLLTFEIEKTWSVLSYVGWQSLCPLALLEKLSLF